MALCLNVFISFNDLQRWIKMFWNFTWHLRFLEGLSLPTARNVSIRHRSRLSSCIFKSDGALGDGLKLALAPAEMDWSITRFSITLASSWWTLQYSNIGIQVPQFSHGVAWLNESRETITTMTKLYRNMILTLGRIFLYLYRGWLTKYKQANIARYSR